MEEIERGSMQSIIKQRCWTFALIGETWWEPHGSARQEGNDVYELE